MTQTDDLFTTPQTNKDNPHQPANPSSIAFSFQASDHLDPTRPLFPTPNDAAPDSTTEPRRTSTAPPNATFTFEQVQQLLQMCQAQRMLPPPPTFPPPPLTQPQVLPEDPYNLLKIEQYASQGLPIKFDGEPVNFATFIQEAGAQINISLWKDSTLITIGSTQYNLLHDFMQIPKQAIVDQATDRWTKPELLPRHNKKATKEFHIKLLSLFLLNSLTTAFRTTIQNRASTLLRHDGQLLFWLICNHVHSSKNAFHKSIRDIIKNRSLSTDDKGNVETYVNFLRHQLTHLQSDESDTSVNDLLEPIFQQLFTTGIDRLSLAIDDWYEGHMSNTAPLTPLQLLNKTDEKIQLLRCANKLTPKNEEPQIMALQSLLQEQNNKFIAAFSSISNSLSRPPHHQRTNSGTYHRGPLNSIPWKHQPPKDPYEVRLYQNKEWRWCPKCDKQNGLWVTSHKPSQHDDYQRSRPSSPASILRSQTPPPYQVLRSSPPGTPSKHKRGPPSPTPSRPMSPHPKRTQFRAQVAVSDILPSIDDPINYAAESSNDDDNPF